MVSLKLRSKDISLSWCHAASMNLPDPLSPLDSIVHRSRDVFQATNFIGTELLYRDSSMLSYIFPSMWRGTLENIAYEFVLTSPAVSCMSGSSNLYRFHDGWYVAIQLLFCGVLPSGLVQYSSQHSCVIAVKLFLHTFRKRPCGSSI